MLRLLPDDAVQISRDCGLLLESRNRFSMMACIAKTFIPISVEEFPLEGSGNFRSLPFAGERLRILPILLGADPKERFVEVFIDTEKHLKKVNDALKGKSDNTTA